MKKIILLTLTVLMMVGCNNKNPDGSYNIAKSIDISIIVIDTCEYIRAYNRLAHKGNCRFCKERRQKELEELVIKLKEK